MRNKMSLFKGFVMGIIFTTLLSGPLVMANPVMREVVFGVSLRVNGALVDFDADSRPFIMDGRTFCPYGPLRICLGHRLRLTRIPTPCL